MSEWHLQPVTIGDLERVDATLREWEPGGGCGGGLQAGDIGWMLRFGGSHVAASLVQWVSEHGHVGAIVLRDSDAFWLLTIDPKLSRSRSLAEGMADWVIHQKPAGPLQVDGPEVPAVWRQVFSERGFEATTDAWAHLWKPLGLSDIVEVSGVSMVITDHDIRDRVAVQKAAFTGSTFTVDKWHELAKGPSFRAEFDLLARDESGNPVAAVTAWLAGEGKCGMLEPMGTDPAYRRCGHGRRVILAECAALARAGAGSASVVTPESNVGAVAVYQSAGFRRLGLISGMVLR